MELVCDMYLVFLFHIHIELLSFFFFLLKSLNFLKLVLHDILRRLSLQFVGVSYEVKVLFVAFFPLVNPRLTFFVLVKVFCIYTWLQLRHKGRRYISYITPIDIFEPYVILDFLCPVFTQSDALVRKQTAYDIYHLKSYRYLRRKI